MESEIVPTDGQEIEVWSAQAVVGAVVDGVALLGMTLPPSWKGILGRHAKSLLTGGFEPDMVIAACCMAVMRRRPEIAQQIAGDLMVASTGNGMTRGEYESKLALYGAGKQGLLADQRERRAAIEQRRAS